MELAARPVCALLRSRVGLALDSATGFVQAKLVSQLALQDLARA
mgnify:CR=1 FL=1